MARLILSGAESFSGVPVNIGLPIILGSLNVSSIDSNIVLSQVTLQALGISNSNFSLAILQPLSLTNNIVQTSSSVGTLIGTVNNTTPGSSISITSLSVANSLQLVQVGGAWQIQVGSSPPASPVTVTFNLVETRAGFANSPKTTALSVKVANWTNLFTASLASVSTGWQNYGLRVILDPSSLSVGPANGLIRVSFSVTSGTSAGALDLAYIGERSSGISFDGNQVQLLFSGAPNKTGLNGASVFMSDPVAFAYDNTKGLIISMRWSGTEVDASNLASGPTAMYYRSGAAPSDTGAATPVGTFNGPHAEIDFISAVDILG